MKKGEVSLVIIQPEYAFGQSGSTQELAVVPGNSAVHYEVEMVSFVKVGDIMESVHLNIQLPIGYAFAHLIRKASHLCRKRNPGI